jgi:hypothetical protein
MWRGFGHLWKGLGILVRTLLILDAKIIFI